MAFGHCVKKSRAEAGQELDNSHGDQPRAHTSVAKPLYSTSVAVPLSLIILAAIVLLSWERGIKLFWR
jgi:hypothetical protein